ncbi:MAG: lysophospholipid acyltransferase family protein [Pirellulales bacterium]|nr:lysophospholipid acyltransferase family protein [Pirellulales bacterium]
MRAWFGKLILKLIGWRLEGGKPALNKYVIIAAPHTSNWDLLVAVAMSMVLGIYVHWVGKHTLFRWPFGGFMRWIGGVPVDRRSRHNAVQQIAAEFARHDEFILMVPPEGTRHRPEYWKSGFYYIAQKAKVPIAMGFLDYGRKVGGIGPLLHVTGDLKADVQVLRDFYAGMTGYYPDNFCPPRLREEVEAPADAKS